MHSQALRARARPASPAGIPISIKNKGVHFRPAQQGASSTGLDTLAAGSAPAEKGAVEEAQPLQHACATPAVRVSVGVGVARYPSTESIKTEGPA
jgi:hypothetical protein